MISQNSIDEGSSVAQLLGEKDIGLAPLTGSPLASLVAASLMGVTSDSPDVSEHAFYLQSQPISETYETNFDIVKTAISEAVSAHISFAKNVVVPSIEKLTKAVQEQMDAVINSINTNYEVKTKELPEPMYNDALVTAIKTEATGSSLIPETGIKLPTLAPQEIYALMLSGSGSFDEKIRLWITTLGDDFFSGLYGSIFSCEAGTSPQNSQSFSQLVNNKQTGTDAALAIYLISQRLEQEVPEGVEMPLSQYKSILNSYRKTAIETMARALTSHENALRNGSLVISYNNTDKEILVNGDVYRKWLETGGSPEILAGACVSGNASYVVAGIDDRKEEYLQNLSMHLSLMKTQRINDSFAIMKRALRENVMFGMKSHVSEEDEMFLNGGYVAKVEEFLDKELAELTSKVMDNVSGVCTHVLTKTRFYYTDSGKFLDSMEKAAKANPGIDPREAALIATIEYVSDFLAEQTQVI